MRVRTVVLISAKVVRIGFANTRKILPAFCLAFCLGSAACAARKPVAAGASRSATPPPTAETVQHCVVIKQENANTVTCSCDAVNTKIDAKTGHTTLICKTTQESN